MEGEYFEGVGRRKKAIARVRVFAGGSEIIINNKSAEEYFGRESDRHTIVQPLIVTGTQGQYSVSVKVRGGGDTGQADAVQMGLARALVEVNPDFRPTLRKAGLLTRDPRIKERKKPGLKRARKAPQYTKR